MNSINELNEAILKKYNEPRERKLGRYSATDVYKIKRGELTPENFFKPKPIDMKGVKNIFRGYAYESQLLKEFNELGVEQERNGDCQLKIEYKINEEITLVMKPDFVLPMVALETKAPNKLKDEIPLWYTDQCEIQYRLLNKKIVMVFINTNDNEYPLLNGVEYKPSDIRWKNICECIINYHKKVKELYGK
jgi:hypothetical protein